MNGSKLLKIATYGVAGPLLVLLVYALGSRPVHVERAILLALGLAPTAMTFHFAEWLERIERTLRIGFMPADRGVVFRLRLGIACSLLALVWAGLTSVMGAFDFRTMALMLGPVIALLGIASRSIDGAVERVQELAEAA